jgi:hypothetical protein
MSTTALLTSPAPHDPTLDEPIEEIAPLVGVVGGYGPPVLLLAVPWVLMGLIVAGPFTLLLTFAAVAIAVVMLLAALTAAVVVAPYLLVQRLRRHASRRPVALSPAARRAVPRTAP